LFFLIHRIAEHSAIDNNTFHVCLLSLHPQGVSPPRAAASCSHWRDGRGLGRASWRWTTLIQLGYIIVSLLSSTLTLFSVQPNASKDAGIQWFAVPVALQHIAALVAEELPLFAVSTPSATTSTQTPGELDPAMAMALSSGSPEIHHERAVDLSLPTGKRLR